MIAACSSLVDIEIQCIFAVMMTTFGDLLCREGSQANFPCLHTYLQTTELCLTNTKLQFRDNNEKLRNLLYYLNSKCIEVERHIVKNLGRHRQNVTSS